MFRLLAIAVLAVGALTSVPTPSARAGLLAVTRFDDPPPDGCTPGDCSLREAIIAANAVPGADTISLAAGTYTLTIAGHYEDNSATGDLDISSDLTISGASRTTTSISSSVPDRVLQIISGTVSITDITIQGGNALPADLRYGGGIQNGGALHMDHVTITQNSTGEIGDGGGIHNIRGATLTVANSLIVGNNAGGGVRGYGGGIYNGGSIQLDHVTIAQNSAEYGAGGIVNLQGATLTIANSSIAANNAGDGYGGGIVNDGELLITNSTIRDNYAYSSPAHC